MKEKTKSRSSERLYLHIPFCVRKCSYCDFVSFAGKEAFYEAYTDALCNEIEAFGRAIREKNISSVYIGGGTPSVLPSELMEKITRTLKDSFSLTGLKERRKGLRLQKIVRPTTEFSIECNPGTVDLKKMKAYKKMGINRISFGLQSTDPDDLKILGRIHSFDDFTDSFWAARDAGFDNINVDLMQAIPGQTAQKWLKTLVQVCTMRPEHISAYSLMVEEGTPFYERKQKGLLELPDEETERTIYYDTRELLEKAGYRRYEISNYALPGFPCVHNTGYWRRDNYLGFGLNSSSLWNNVRWKNTEDPDSYLDLFSDPLKAGALADSLMEAVRTRKESFEKEEAGAICDYQRLSHKEQMEEFMFLGLRMTEGISRSEFFARFGQDFDFTYGETVRELKGKDLVDVREDRVFLTDRGVDLSNVVLAEFLLQEQRSEP